MKTNLITKEHYRDTNEERGIAYVVLLIYLTIMTCLGLSFIQKVGLEAKIVMNKTISSQAQYLAESAASHAMWGLFNIPGFAPDPNTYYMHSFANGRYGYKVRKPTETTFATIAAIGVMGESVVEQGYVPYILPSNILTTYGSSTNALPFYRRMLGADWTDPGDVLIGGASTPLWWVELEGCPIRKELVGGVIDDIGEVKIAVFDGRTWGNAQPFTHANKNYKSFDIAYESQSGDALVVGWDTGDLYVNYNIWDGNTWLNSNPLQAFNLSSGSAHDLVMASQPGGDEILIAVVTSNSEIQFIRWNGSAFSDLGTIETTATHSGFRVVDIVYEHQSGDAMVVWSRSGDSALKYRMWNGVVLEPEGSLPDFGRVGYVVHGAADPDSAADYIIVGAIDNFYDINVAIWDGDNWIDSREVETAGPAYNIQCFDIAWEASGEDLLIVYSTYGQTNLSFLPWKKGTLLADSTEQTGPDFGGKPSNVRLLPIAGTERIVCLVTDDLNQLYYSLWTGNKFRGDPGIVLESSIPSAWFRAVYDLAEANVPRTGGTGSGSGVPNTAPTVNAGPDQSVCPPGMMADLDGTVSDDGLPNPPNAVTTTWSKVSGPGTVTFDDDSLVDTRAVFSAAGEYVLRLTADDSDLSASGEVTITVVDPDEILVNTETADIQTGPAVAVASDGSYVITWTSYNQDMNTRGIYAQRYDSNGVAVGGEFLVNTTSDENQQNQAVAMDDAGNFVVAWESFHVDPLFSNVFAQRFDANGVKQGSEFRVDAFTGADMQNPCVGMSPTGEFVIAFEALGGFDGDAAGIYARRYDANGTAQGGGFKVNTYFAGDQNYPSVSMDSSSNFVITWSSKQLAGSLEEIYGQRYDASGVTQGGEFLVNTTTDDSQHFSDVAMNDAGNFVVVWQSGSIALGSDIYFQRFDSVGAMLGGETMVNSTTADDQSNPEIDINDSGEFVVSWQSANQDGSGYGVYARRYGAGGSALGDEFLVNTTTTNDQINTDVCVDQDGHFAVTWNGEGSGDVNGVFMSFFPCSTGIQLCNYLIGYWELDEASGSTIASDSSGNGNNGTLTYMDPAVDWVPGHIEGALDFDGIDDYVEVPHVDTLSLTTFSISAWIQMHAFGGSWQSIMTKSTTPSSANYGLSVNGDELWFGFYNSGWVDFTTTNANLVTDRWYHVAVTFDDSIGEGNIYLDGTLFSTGTTTKSPLPNNDALMIGRSETVNENWNGMLDDVRLYNRVLGASEISQLHVLAVGGCSSGGGGGGDTDPPTPDPMTWASPPASAGPTSITMTATTVTDPSGVEYYFECTAGGGNDSSWQDSTTYVDTGLTPDTSYTYRVKARDKSSNQNETGWSTEETATTDTVPEMFVNDIAMGFRSQGPKYFGQATVWIKDDGGADVEGALVTGDWSGAVSEMAMGSTGSDGRIFFESSWVNGGGTYTFTVTDVTKSGYVYNPALNVMTFGSITAP